MCDVCAVFAGLFLQLCCDRPPTPGFQRARPDGVNLFFGRMSAIFLVFKVCPPPRFVVVVVVYTGTCRRRTQPLSTTAQGGPASGAVPAARVQGIPEGVQAGQ